MEYRRNIIKQLCVGTVWTTPIIHSINLPAHAQTSSCPGNFVLVNLTFSGAGPIQVSETIATEIGFRGSDFLPVVSYKFELASQPTNPDLEVIFDSYSIVTQAINETSIIPFSISATSSYDGSPDSFDFVVTVESNEQTINGCRITAISTSDTLQFPIFGFRSSTSDRSAITFVRKHKI